MIGSFLVEGNIPNSSGKAITDISGTANLFTMEPLKIIGGAISGLSRKSTVKDFQFLHSKEHYNVAQ